MAFFSGWLHADVYKEQRSGIEFPATIGRYKRGKVTSNEPEPGKAGVAISYRSDDAEVTVYVRALGDDVGQTSAYFLQDSLAGIKALEAQGIYSNVKIYGSIPDKERAGWKSAVFSSSFSNGFIILFIYCKVASEYLVKIRATTSNPKSDLLLTILESLQDIVDHASMEP